MKMRNPLMVSFKIETTVMEAPDDYIPT